MLKNHIVFVDSLMAASTPNIGYFGTAPLMHGKCFEIPYVEGRLNGASSTA
jgi:hypothetical protein